MTVPVAGRHVAIPLQLSATHMRPPGGSIVCSLGGATMGTGWSVQAAVPPGTDTASLQADIEAVLDLVIAQMSNWEKDSLVSRFNHAAEGEIISLPDELHQVMRCALRVAQETDGAYDPAMGALVDLWGFGPAPRRTTPPDARLITEAMRPGGWKQLSLSDDRTLRQPGGLSLDLSSIAKGFAVDLVAHRLRANNIRHFLVEIGGELYGAGVKPNGSPWWVAVDHASRLATPIPQHAPIVIALHELAVATSGMERCFTHEGRTYAHTINPLTGYPVDNEIVATTVLRPSCMEADAYATALLVMGTTKALEFAGAHHIAAFILDDRGKLHISPAMAAMLD